MYSQLFNKLSTVYTNNNSRGFGVISQLTNSLMRFIVLRRSTVEVRKFEFRIVRHALPTGYSLLIALLSMIGSVNNVTAEEFDTADPGAPNQYNLSHLRIRNSITISDEDGSVWYMGGFTNIDTDSISHNRNHAINGFERFEYTTEILLDGSSVGTWSAVELNDTLDTSIPEEYVFINGQPLNLEVIIRDLTVTGQEPPKNSQIAITVNASVTAEETGVGGSVEAETTEGTASGELMLDKNDWNIIEEGEEKTYRFNVDLPVELPVEIHLKGSDKGKMVQEWGKKE